MDRFPRDVGGTSCTLFLLSALGVLCAAPCSLHAQAALKEDLGGPEGFGMHCLGSNDDGSSGAIDLTPFFPVGLRFFTRTHDTLYLNNNGNVTFDGPTRDYTPQSFPFADRPMIAPFWADVDTRAPGCMIQDFDPPGECEDPSDNGVWWHGEPGRMVFTWHDVGYFQCSDELRNSFQLVLEDSGCAAGGDFDVEFRYARCEWVTGDASAGKDGSGGIPAQAGFDAGDRTNFEEISGSRTDEIGERLCLESNVDDEGVWRFNVRSGEVTCPDAGNACDADAQGACAAGRIQCEGANSTCEPRLNPTPERCDSVDNDCDGSVDEEEDSCLQGTDCFRGRCSAPCFEGECGQKQACVEGYCVPEDCEDACGAGLVCVGGECADPCEGVFCPGDQTCESGICIDPCAGVQCDTQCSTCFEGECLAKCTPGNCPEGLTCDDTGLCVDPRCQDVECEPGLACRGGACVDPCGTATCPAGDVCIDGECITEQERLRRVGAPLFCDNESCDSSRSCSCSLRSRTRRSDPSDLAAVVAACFALGLLVWRRRR